VEVKWALRFNHGGGYQYRWVQWVQQVSAGGNQYQFRRVQ
jgi:hypothetical protein